MILASEVSLLLLVPTSNHPIQIKCASRVENRRSDVSLPVAVGGAFRIAASVRLGVALFSVPAHRTGQAVFPHPALGQNIMLSPTEGFAEASADG
jgi:hypothetical protein